MINCPEFEFVCADLNSGKVYGRLNVSTCFRHLPLRSHILVCGFNSQLPPHFTIISSASSFRQYEQFETRVELPQDKVAKIC